MLRGDSLFVGRSLAKDVIDGFRLDIA